MPSPKGCRYGFEVEDLKQEAAVGVLMAERLHPGDKLARFLRVKGRVHRHKKKEAEWKNMRRSILGVEKASPDKTYERILLHEILDLLPYAVKEETLTVLLEGDGRSIRRMGRIIQEITGFGKEA